VVKKKSIPERAPKEAVPEKSDYYCSENAIRGLLKGHFGDDCSLEESIMLGWIKLGAYLQSPAFDITA